METRHEYSDPTVSPFVRWGPAGYAVFPPNTIYEVANEVLEELEGDANTLDALYARRVRWAQIGGVAAIHPGATWDRVILGFLQDLRADRDTSVLYPHATELLARMLRRPAREAWVSVSDYIVDHIDQITGWNREARHFADLTGESLAATRQHHLVNSLGQPFGQARSFLRLFSLFALADDFAENAAKYPRSLRFALCLDSDVFTGRWQFRFNDQIRSIRWRPDTNHADDQWLAQCLTARLIDDLDRDVWQDRVDQTGNRPIELESTYKWQVDYALEARLLIGNEPECYFRFEDRTVRWINPTPENRAMLTVGCRDRDNAAAEHNLVSRLLSWLSWKHRAPARIKDFTIGARRSLPWISMTRSGYAHIQTHKPEKSFPPSFSQEAWDLLGLFREAECADSTYYSFLAFWKVIELAIKNKEQRQDWVNRMVPEYPDPKLVEVLNSEQGSFYAYLEHWGRNAVAHVFKEPWARPDEWRDFRRFRRDVSVVRWLANKLVHERIKRDSTVATNLM